MTTQGENQYLDLLRKIITEGDYREGRNGATYSLFGAQMRFNMRDGFPLLTTKRVHFKSITVELLWFLTGSTNIKFLHDQGVTIWDEWADENGELGPVYGSQWRNWNAGIVPGIDQINNLLQGLANDPYGRRHIVTAWNPEDLGAMALPPCHMFFQCHVANDDKLNLHMYQRSADWFLGAPFNVASYALLLQILARELGYDPGELITSFGDLHLYANHLDAAKEQLRRTPLSFPNLIIAPGNGIFDLKYEDFAITGYEPCDPIKAPVSK